MTRVDQAVESIRNMVINKEYDSNGYLPSEGELSEKLGVSRASIREAVRTLEVRGFVKRIHGKGISVVDKGIKNMSQSIQDMMDMNELDPKDVLEARWILETRASRLAVERATQKDINELRVLVEQLEKGKKIDAPYLKCDFEFHQKLVECSGNAMLVAIVQAYSKWLYDIIEKSSNATGDTESKSHFHRNIYEALVKKDKDLICNAVKAHLSSTAKNVEINLSNEI